MATLTLVGIIYLFAPSLPWFTSPSILLSSSFGFFGSPWRNQCGYKARTWRLRLGSWRDEEHSETGHTATAKATWPPTSACSASPCSCFWTPSGPNRSPSYRWANIVLFFLSRIRAFCAAPVLNSVLRFCAFLKFILTHSHMSHLFWIL